MTGDWLLCDFHIHTTFSDGHLDLNEVVDLYGTHGFDVINISDHVLDRESQKRYSAQEQTLKCVKQVQYESYLKALWSEARRAWETYNMLLIPGMEVTNDTNDYHILCIDGKQFIDPDLPVEEIVTQIHDQGGIAIAPHPHRGHMTGTHELTHLWDHHEQYAPLFDAWEVANRDDLFNVVGLKRFNYVANSDFHQPRHLYSWKTLLQCEKNTEAVKAALRDNSRVAISLFRQDKPALNGRQRLALQQ